MSTLAIRRSRRNLKRHSFGHGILPTQSDIDDAWLLGFDLGSRDVPGLPPHRWADEQKRAFHQGYQAGVGRNETDSAEVDRLWEAYEAGDFEADEDEVYRDAGEYGEARMAVAVGRERGGW